MLSDYEFYYFKGGVTMHKDFLALSHFSKSELDGLFALTRELKEKQKKGIPHRHLEGKSVALIFEKSSTRTRVSFEVGVAQSGTAALHLLRHFPDGAR